MSLYCTLWPSYCSLSIATTRKFHHSLSREASTPVSNSISRTRTYHLPSLWRASSINRQRMIHAMSNWWRGWSTTATESKVRSLFQRTIARRKSWMLSQSLAKTHSVFSIFSNQVRRGTYIASIGIDLARRWKFGGLRTIRSITNALSGSSCLAIICTVS